MTTTTATADDLLQDAIRNRTQWEAELDDARRDLDQLMNAPVAPAEARTAATTRAAARERVGLADDALKSAKGAETRARRAVVASLAEAAAQEVADADKALADVQRRLQQVESAYLAKRNPMLDKQAELGSTRRQLDLHRQALEVAAEGGEVPSSLLRAEELPAALQVGGVLPAQTALAAAENARVAADEAAVLAVEQAELDAALRVVDPLRRKALEQSGRQTQIGEDTTPNVPYGRASERALGALETDLARVEKFTPAIRQALLTLARLVSDGYARRFGTEILLGNDFKADPVSMPDIVAMHL